MKILLRPQEYYYLYSPLRSDPIEMFKYTLQGLCYEGHLDICYKNIYININDPHKRSRAFVKLGSGFKNTNSYSSAETLVLSLFEKGELRLHEIKKAALLKLEGKIKNFKSEFVYLDVLNQNYC